MFILDQYGYKDVPFDLMRQIFQCLPNAEIIMTIAVDWILDFCDHDGKTRELLSKLGFPEDFLNYLAKNKKGKQKIKGEIQLLLAEKIREISGARHRAGFILHTKTTHERYTRNNHRNLLLLHLSNHPKAHDVMMQILWGLKTNHFLNYIGWGMQMLSYNSSDDKSATGQQLLELDGYRIDNYYNDMTEGMMCEKMQEDVLKVIYEKYSQGVLYKDFHASQCNWNPTTDKHLKEIVRVLIRQKELGARSSEGSTKRRRAVEPEDTLFIPKQCTFSFSYKERK